MKGAFVMPNKGKIQAEEKIRLVQACEEGELSQTEAAKQAGVDDASIRDWLQIFYKLIDLAEIYRCIYLSQKMILGD